MPSRSKWATQSASLHVARSRAKRTPPSDLPWPIEMVPLNKLKRAKRNSRTHPPQQIDQIVKSIRHFGYVDPVLADESLSIIGGHARAEAAARAGLQEIPVIVISGLSDSEKRALAIADNKIAANAGWDFTFLREELVELEKALPKIKLDLEITGFDSLEVQGLFGELAPKTGSAKVGGERQPEYGGAQQTRTVNRIGDLWDLGSDKILCDESTLSANDIRRIAGQHCAILIVLPRPSDLVDQRVRHSAHSEEDSPAQYFYAAAAGEFADSVCKALSNAVKGAANDAILFVIMESLRSRKALGTGAILTPRQADIAIRHWQARSNRDAILATTRENFDHVARMRRKGGRAS